MRIGSLRIDQSQSPIFLGRCAHEVHPRTDQTEEDEEDVTGFAVHCEGVEMKSELLSAGKRDIAAEKDCSATAEVNLR